MKPQAIKITALFLTVFFVISCEAFMTGLTEGDENVEAGLEEKGSGYGYFLRAESAVVFYNLGDKFNKLTDFKAYKYSNSGKVWVVPNENTTVTIDGLLIEEETEFVFWGRAHVVVEHAGLSDSYIAVVNEGGYGGGNTGNGGNGSGEGGGIGWEWADEQEE
ncbi:MAG: hypothetical protein LBC53_01300 [Spirochaetaceae bacterium]|nr:hypothetical protein [Spirochaetaceae bacterium]